MQTIFTSKKQFHQFSDLVSETFDLKKSRTKHKLASKSGYKNANALLASIPNESRKPSSVKTSAKNLFHIESMIGEHFDKTDLYEYAERRVLHYSSCWGAKEHIWEMPLYMCMLLDGFYFTTQEWLDSYVYEAATTERSRVVFSTEDQENFKLKLSTLQHLLGGYIFNEEELLQFNDIQLEELIYASNLEQYNLIANSKAIISKMDSNSLAELTARYLRAMVEINGEYHDFYRYEDSWSESCDYIHHSLISNIKARIENYNHRTIEDQKNDFILLTPPPSNRLYKKDYSLIVCETIPSHVLEYFLRFNTFETHDEFGKIVFSSYGKDENDWDDFDFAIRKHFRYFWEESANHLVNDLISHKEEFLLSDLLLSFEIAIQCNISKETLDSFLNYTVKEDGFFYNPFAEESMENLDAEYSFNGFNMMTWLIMSETASYDFFHLKEDDIEKRLTNETLLFLIKEYYEDLNNTDFPTQFFCKYLGNSRIESFLHFKDKNEEKIHPWVYENYEKIMVDIYESETLLDSIKNEMINRKKLFKH